MITIYTIIHIIGAILGAGGAYASDGLFFMAIRDKNLSHKELSRLGIASYFVWTGLIILIISGLLMFSTNPEFYMSSSKFQIKMFIVLVIFINGIYFHSSHFPLMRRHAGINYSTSEEFNKKKSHLMASGAISFTSWTLALTLGIMRSIDISFIQAFSIYIVIEIVAVFVAVTFFKRML